MGSVARLALTCLLLLPLAACRVSFNAAPPPLPPLVPGTPAEQKPAVEAAVAIVEAFDRGEFDAAWNGGSAMLKQSVGRTAFIAVMANSRARLGRAGPRPAPRIGFASQVDPGGPVGEYAVFAVDSNFSGTVVTEKVVMVREAGRWKLGGYWMSSKLSFNKGK
jgi:hypothetical protein